MLGCDGHWNQVIYSTKPVHFPMPTYCKFFPRQEMFFRFILQKFEGPVLHWSACEILREVMDASLRAAGGIRVCKSQSYTRDDHVPGDPYQAVPEYRSHLARFRTRCSSSIPHQARWSWHRYTR